MNNFVHKLDLTEYWQCLWVSWRAIQRRASGPHGSNILPPSSVPFAL